jgi:Asp-tRNA(Asn)/Glu-tRNA(Gln) amidotransferase C subunit
MVNFNLEMKVTRITFTDLNDVLQFVEQINQTEGERLKFKLVLKDMRRGKEIRKKQSIS